MNIKLHKMILVSVAAVMVAISSAYALTDMQVAGINQKVDTTPAAELSAVVSQLVVNSSKLDRSETAIAAVKAVAAKNRSAVLSTVSAIAAATPEVAPVAAATAASIFKDKAAAIVSAASKAAPAYAGPIAQAVIDVAPEYTAAVMSGVERASKVSASAGGVTSQILSGPISGTIPSTTPTPVPTVVPGADDNRTYFRP